MHVRVYVSSQELIARRHRHARVCKGVARARLTWDRGECPYSGRGAEKYSVAVASS